MRDLVAHELRRQHRKRTQLERRLALVDVTGKVKAGSQDMEKRTLRLVLGKSADGKEILSAPVRWDQQGAGTFKMHAVPKDGEQMTLHSPSGTIGPTSLARWGTYDKDTEPPSKKKDEAVLEFGGKGRIAFGKDDLVISLGDAKVKITKDKIAIGVGDGFEITAEELKMLVRLRGKGGSRPAHYKGGKDSDGDVAVDGNDDVLI
ncbi:phage baseplate assembly protein V [Methylobacterium aquaticum]|uniref:phage baseplate assembly protein V n=1 Tax=Methylobacterium aquaticum TaxID=270351 RepID=UPI001933E747|nr:phage baseplate assembly protein V [Methylobacterium aquaticum]QRE74384.1 phage baseplate protein [Methylobacterium aquaticum]